MQTFEFIVKPPGEVLQEYYDCDEQRQIIIGPLGSGKTFQTIQKIIRLMVRQAPNEKGIRPSRWLAIRNTYPDLMSTTVKDWLELVGDLGKFRQGGLEAPTHFLEFGLEDGTTVKAEMIFQALDRDDAVKKLRGQQLTGVWLSEAKELSWGIVSMADLRVGRYPSVASAGVGCSWYGMVGDTNAPDADETEWVYRLAEVDMPDGWSFFRQPGGVKRAGTRDDGKPLWKPNIKAENLINLSQTQDSMALDEKERAKQGLTYYRNGMQGKDDDWIAVNLANEYGFVSSGKPIFPEYVDSLMCKDVEYEPKLLLNIGVDFGLTPAAIFGQQSPTGQVRWIDELVLTDAGAKRFGEMLAAKIMRDYPQARLGAITTDPAGDIRDQTSEGTAIKMLKVTMQALLGYDVIVQPAHTNSFSVRREAVAVPMGRLIDGQPGFIISPKCEITRKALGGGYSYKRVQKPGSVTYHDKPDKNRFSHPAEAGQYLNLGLGEGQALLKTAVNSSGNIPRVADNDFFTEF